MAFTRDEIISALKARKVELNEQIKQMDRDADSEKTEQRRHELWQEQEKH